MKKLLIMILFSGVHFVAHAQCEEVIFGRKLEKGMLIMAVPNNNGDKRYVAEVTGFNGTDFSCRFLHSNSVYEFVDVKLKSEASSTLLEGTVKSNIGGSYKAGTVFIINVFMPDPDYCDLSNSTFDIPYTIIATFPDKKSYLAKIGKTDSSYSIRFVHSKSIYKTDKNFKVLSSIGGGYGIGSQMEVVHARLLSFD